MAPSRRSPRPTSGLVDGDTAPDTPPTCSSAATSAAIGRFVSSCSGAADADYDIVYVNGTVEISPSDGYAEYDPTSVGDHDLRCGQRQEPHRRRDAGRRRGERRPRSRLHDVLEPHRRDDEQRRPVGLLQGHQRDVLLRAAAPTGRPGSWPPVAGSSQRSDEPLRHLHRLPAAGRRSTPSSVTHGHRRSGRRSGHGLTGHRRPRTTASSPTCSRPRRPGRST